VIRSISICSILILISVISCTSKSGKKPSPIIDKTNCGKVISIIDGDTYEVMFQGDSTMRVRMEGIDAPERGMPFYKRAKTYLSELCFGKKVCLKITGRDSNDRFLAYTYLEDGKELSEEMIRAGLAWHFKKYNSDTSLSKLEIEARYLKKGLWVDETPMAPWTNRSLHKQGISTKDTFNIFGSE